MYCSGPLYEDYGYVDDTSYYIELLKSRGLNDKMILSFFKRACANYSRYGLNTYFRPNNQDMLLIPDPSALLTTLSQTYIGYVPHKCLS